MESQPKIELLTLGLQVDVCGGIILPLFRGKVDLKNVKSSIVEPKHFGLEPSLFEGLNLFKTAQISGLIIFVGVSGWLCYQFIRTVWVSLRSKVIISKSSSFTSLDSSDFDQDEKEMLEEDCANYIDLKHAYFGPSKSPDDNRDLSLNISGIDNLAGNWLRTNVQNFSNRSLRKSGTGSASCCSPLGGGIPRDKSSFNFTFDQSYKSLGFSSFNSYGGGSLESIVSELSIDISTLCETPHDQTAISLFDKLQQEIVQLKSNCDSMTEDFTQVKHNRYLPGLSNLLETSGKFGFSSGTTVDENYFDRQQAKDCFRGLYSLTTLSNSISFDLSECEDISSQTSSSGRRKGFDFKQEEVPSLEWDECDIEVEDTNECFPFKKLKQKGSDICVVQNIGCATDLLEYARKEWQGGTQKATIILKGYEEIRRKHSYRYLRRVRGDNFCAIRASLFQCLSSGISLPSCDEALKVIQSSYESDQNHWLRQWSFINRLPYNKNKLLPSIETCLHILDDISGQLKVCTTDRSNVLAELMNSEPELDLLMMEAIKLHMIVSAIKLYSNKSEMPTFGMLMFARDTSETPKDFMNNHLLPIGDTAGLEQVEMFLLGYTLRIVIRVFRTSSFGTSDFICYFPGKEDNQDLPEISIIAEDDRHYNILTM
ncbi:uncharacterized protein [Bemisia tabaci]|uniref:uncharacterized protein isoform X2 n=1 Tax=Bemisia tabaci TaxID=7038 RepID=UPI003B283648